MTDSNKPMFWRDSRMPHVELRKVEDGRKLCYASHSHTQWSLGAITQGQSTFIYRDDELNVSAGCLVIMNPNWVHACNPIDNQPWAYLMLYVDSDWLTRLRFEAGLLDELCWQDLATATLSDKKWFADYCQLAECLLDSDSELLEKQTAVVEYLTALMFELAGRPVEPVAKTPEVLQMLADYLKANSMADSAANSEAQVSLDTLCELSGYSPGHLIRCFKQHFGFTPHAYLINYRIQCAQEALKRGQSIAETAVNAGFADQPHFQRTFKKLLAVTPKQYRQSLLNNKKDAAGEK